MSPRITVLFDRPTYSYTYILIDDLTRSCAIIDPVCDYDPVTGQVTTQSADELIRYLRGERLQVRWLLETHVHADHLSAGAYLRDEVGGTHAIGAAVCDVQQVLGSAMAMEAGFKTDGSQFDRLLHHGDRLDVGTLSVEVMATPGHTPACASFVCATAEATDVFVGDTLFMPDFGTGRTDFPGGCARTLYRSIARLLELPSETRVHVGHDYGTKERPTYCSTTSIAEQRSDNVHLVMHNSEAAFVEFRTSRDQSLGLPGLFAAAVPWNLRGGRPPLEPVTDRGAVELGSSNSE